MAVAFQRNIAVALLKQHIMPDCWIHYKGKRRLLIISKKTYEHSLDFTCSCYCDEYNCFAQNWRHVVVVLSVTATHHGDCINLLQSNVAIHIRCRSK